MIRLYAFVAGLHDRLPAALTGVPVGPILAVTGPDEDDPAAQGLAVQSLLDVADAVLPVRFGERFADDRALLDAVSPRVPELADLLAGVDGCVELAVRAGRPAPETARAASGTDYMRSRLRRATADAASADALHTVLRDRARSVVLADTTLTRLVHDASYLVERSAVDEFAACVRGYAEAHPDLDLVCTGPWAPASFVEAAA